MELVNRFVVKHVCYPFFLPSSSRFRASSFFQACWVVISVGFVNNCFLTCTLNRLNFVLTSQSFIFRFTGDRYVNLFDTFILFDWINSTECLYQICSIFHRITWIVFLHKLKALATISCKLSPMTTLRSMWCINASWFINEPMHICCPLFGLCFGHFVLVDWFVEETNFTFLNFYIEFKEGFFPPSFLVTVFLTLFVAFSVFSAEVWISATPQCSPSHWAVKFKFLIHSQISYEDCTCCVKAIVIFSFNGNTQGVHAFRV